MRDSTELSSLRLNGLMSCPGCGYDLRGLPSATVCPECAGNIMDLTTARFGKMLRLWRRGAALGVLVIPLWLPWQVFTWAGDSIWGYNWGSLALAVLAFIAFHCTAAIGTTVGIWCISSRCGLRVPRRVDTLMRSAAVVFSILTVAVQLLWSGHISDTFFKTALGWVAVIVNLWWGFQIASLVHLAHCSRDFLTSNTRSKRLVPFALGLAIYRVFMWISSWSGLLDFLRDIPEWQAWAPAWGVYAPDVLTAFVGIFASAMLYRDTQRALRVQRTPYTPALG